MPGSRVCITAEMYAEDNYRLQHSNGKSTCLWRSTSGCSKPKRYHLDSAFRSRYNRHLKKLQDAFEKGVFNLIYNNNCGFGVYAVKSLRRTAKEDREKVQRLGALAQNCHTHDSGGWSIVEKN